MNRVCSVLALALLLAGCVSSKNPIGQTVGFKPDAALTGVWLGRSEKDDSSATVYILPKKDGGMTALAIQLPGKKDEGGWTAIDLKVATLNAYHYMSAREILDDGEPVKDPADYTLLLYRLDDADTLTIYQIDRQKAGDAVTAKILAGTAEKDDSDKGEWGDVHITADAAALDAFMKTPEGAALFSEKWIVLHRKPNDQ